MKKDQNTNTDLNINPEEALTAVFGKPKEIADGITAFFGPVISSYSRAQAIADGVLVDVSKVIDGDTAQRCPFKYPVAMTIGAWSATITAGGKWVNDGNGRTTKVDLYSVCGPDDTAEPVITIMLQGED